MLSPCCSIIQKGHDADWLLQDVYVSLQEEFVEVQILDQMEIQALPHSSIQIVNGQAETLNCVSEIGRFGICFAENGEVKNNLDAGYLVRTKAKNVNEGGVCAGFACLNTIAKFD